MSASRSTWTLASAIALLCSLSACGSPAAAPPSTTAATTTFKEQVAAGQGLYGQHCANCHGAGGEGTAKAPAVVGIAKGALPLDPPAGAKVRATQFKTVADIATFAVKNMPADAPGSLSEDSYWAILAFNLSANGIDLGEKKLTPELAATLTIPRN